MNQVTGKTLRDFRPLADLRDSRSFDMAGRDSGPSSVVSGTVLTDLAKADERIVLGTADLQFATMMAQFRYEFPERLLQFGISERNMLGAAAGLAASGFIPYVCTFACFAGILGMENIKTDMAYTNVPVRVLGTHAGISMGFFATSHHATEDIGALRSVANLMILSPCDAPSYEAMLRATVDYPGPIYFRLGRGRDPIVYEDSVQFSGIGAPSKVLDNGNKLLIVTTGAMVAPSIKAAKALGDTSVFDAHTIKPFDPSTVIEAVAEGTKILVVEEHNTEGGLGTIVRESLMDNDIFVPVYKHGLYDEFAIIGPPQHLYQYYGLDDTGVSKVATRLLETEKVAPGSLWTEADRQSVLEAIQAKDRLRSS